MARLTLRGFGECNFCDMARTLRMGENAFRRSCSFRELGVVPDVMQPKAENRRLIADLENAIGLARNAKKTALHHLPIDVIVQRVFVIGKMLRFAAPEIEPEPESERALTGVSIVAEQIVIQQGHRLDVSAVHDVVGFSGVPFLPVARR